MRNLAVIAVLFLSACGPQNIQNTFLMTGNDGSLVYHVTGFTDLRETKPGDSVSHINKLLTETDCPQGVEIVRLNEFPSGNGFGKFWYFDAEAKCK